MIKQNDDVFSYYEPSKSLKPYIAYYSIQHKNFSFTLPWFAPDLGGSLIISVGKDSTLCILWGPFNIFTTDINNFHQPILRYFIEFHPGGLSRLVHSDVSSLLNKKVPFETINSEINSEIIKILDCFPNQFDVIEQLDILLLKYLFKTSDLLETGRLVLTMIQEMNSMKKINEIVIESFYSHRQLNRYMKMFTGVSLKEYVKIKRFNIAVELLKDNDLSIEEIAQHLGYYDNSHFIKDFVGIARITPNQFRLNMSNFYNENLKRF